MLVSNFEKYKTNISKAYWCSFVGLKANFEAIKVQFDDDDANTVAWFDKLFEGGLSLPSSQGKPITMLLTGPPGSGKTTLALEFCYRMARHHNLFSLYISTEADTQRMVYKIKSFGYQDVDRHILEFNGEVPDINVLTIWGRDKIEEYLKKWETLSEVVSNALEMLAKWLTSDKVRDNLTNKIKEFIWGNAANTTLKASPHILVIDSLNIVTEQEKGAFFEQIISMSSGATKLILVILDSGSSDNVHEYWEYYCDNVVRLDYNIVQLDSTRLRDYFIRTIEVVKARYQSHIWGKHQLKIYSEFSRPDEDSDDFNARMRRAHPYREEGGIFIYPAIHYYLSLYKRRGSTTTPDAIPTPLKSLNEILGGGKSKGGGFPKGRCTAFMGCRGGHKSHFGYLHIINRIVNENEGGLIISLRDDEEMTRATMKKILKQEFLEKESEDLTEEVLEKTAKERLEGYEHDDRLEILYYPPGYITPDEFFHRMFMSIHRLKRKNDILTVMFNSLDQLSARFPLCSHQPIFVPGMIETLTGENITSIFIAVDEPGQPAEQYGLLPMADLILTFNRFRFRFEDYFKHHEENSLQLETAHTELKEKVYKIRERSQNSFREVIVLQISRFFAGQQAGARGLLELVDKDELPESLLQEAGLHFTQLSSRFSQGDLIR